ANGFQVSVILHHAVRVANLHTFTGPLRDNVPTRFDHCATPCGVHIVAFIARNIDSGVEHGRCHGSGTTPTVPTGQVTDTRTNNFSCHSVSPSLWSNYYRQTCNMMLLCYPSVSVYFHRFQLQPFPSLPHYYSLM